MQEQSIKIGECIIKSSDSVKNIGAVLDPQLKMKDHVNHVARSCYAYLRMMSQIRPNLTSECAVNLAHAFITSKLDCMNSLLVGIPDNVIHKLQLIQNNAARIILKKKKYDHVTPLLKQLHWLPVRARIKFKICLLTYKALHGLAPPYISGLLERYTPGRSLRSANQLLLKPKVPNMKTVGGRAFHVCAPVMWNALPDNLRAAETVETFKTNLKTHLFREVYG